MIKRDFYLKRIIENMWNDEIKVITGIRRCGKSVLLFDLFYNYLKIDKNVDDNQIIKIQLDQRRNYKYRNPINLCEYIESIVLSNKDKKYYLFIDEVQLTEKVIDYDNGKIEVTIYDMLNELKAYKNLDVYVTLSNSHALSKDIATEFRGRASQIHIFPLSFEEYYSVQDGDENKELNEYMLYGGLPHLLKIDSEREKKNYLSSLYKELYIKDIIERYKIEREDILNLILDYLASQLSSLTNSTNIANSLSSMQHIKINPALIDKYISYIEESFLINIAHRYDIKGKHYFNYPNKYYYVDTELRNIRLNYRQFDVGHLMENIIYNELIKRGYSVDIGVVYDRTDGKKNQKEIDFVVNDFDKKIYIQSAYRMDDSNKMNSKLSSLTLTNDFFKKL